MNTEHEDYAHLWQYLAESFLGREMFHMKVVEKIKTHTLWSVTLFWKTCRLWENVEKMVKPQWPQVKIKCSACTSACSIIKATNTHLDMYYFLLFDCNVGYMKTPQCYDITCTLPVLFFFLHTLNKLRTFTIYIAKMIWNLWIYSVHKHTHTHTHTQQNWLPKAFAWEKLISTAQMAFPIYVYFCSPLVI